MKFSENWLRSIADPGCDRATLMQRLTMAGLEVEGVEMMGEGLKGVVVGEIIAAERHPNADKLQVCRVNIGAAEPLQIVCGAPNARVGLKAPVATIGARMPGNGMEIKRAKLRDVESVGMLCSAKELAIADDASGLWELPVDARVGQGIGEFLGLPDASIEIKLTPNRPDCLGLEGLAAEVRALFDLPHASADSKSMAPVSSLTRAVHLHNPADCPRYLGRVIEGIDPAAQTPLWMRERLRRSGLRSISVAVDCSNYVLIEMGQPTHAFDHDQLRGSVEIRRARAGETIKLLDEREVALDEGFLVIADSERPVAVAGVMGGWETRVTDSTRNLFLECAFFAPAAVQGRARKLGLHTDASHRFERGVDPELAHRAMERLSQLIIEIAGGQPGAVIEAVSVGHLPVRPEVTLRRARLERVLGLRIEDQRVTAILTSLGMQVRATPEGWTARAPSKRFDIEIEEDLIEEVARIHGYDNVPVNIPRGEIALRLEPEALVRTGDVRQALLTRGYSEALHFSFVAAPVLERWNLLEGAVALSNPLNADLGVMRTSLLPGLVDALKHNQSRQQDRVRLFEIGKAFHAGDPPLETPRLAGLVSGAARAEQWAEGDRAVDFFDIKGDLEQVLALAGPGADFAFAPLDEPGFLHGGRSAAVLRDGRQIGLIGCLDPRLARALDVDGDVYVFEVELSAVLQRNVPVAGEVSRYPSVRRDLALVVDQSVPFARIRDRAQGVLGDLLRECFLFDEFVGPSLPAGTRSLAMGLILQDSSRTLTDTDVDSAMQAVVAALGEHTGARLRG
jgi:phenylalanyl-tRNA synthetase beta chain